MTTEPTTIQADAPQSPVLTVQAPKFDRIFAFFAGGVPVLMSPFAIFEMVRLQLREPSILVPVLILLTPPVMLVFFYWTIFILIPKTVFFENHIVVRSKWGRSIRLIYQEIIEIDVDYDTLFLLFKGGSLVPVPRSMIRTESFIRWLAERGAAAAWDFKLGESSRLRKPPEQHSILPPKQNS